MPINKLSWQASGIYTMDYVCVSHLRWTISTPYGDMFSSECYMCAYITLSSTQSVPYRGSTETRVTSHPRLKYKRLSYQLQVLWNSKD